MTKKNRNTTKEENELPKIMTITEFAEHLGVSRSMIIETFLYRKYFPAFRIGRCWRIKAEEAFAYVERKGKSA